MYANDNLFSDSSSDSDSESVPSDTLFCSDTEDISDMIDMADEQNHAIPGMAQRKGTFAQRVFVTQLLYCMCLWQSVNTLTTGALDTLIVFLFQVFQIIGGQDAFLACVAAMFPASIYALRKWLGIDRSDFTEYICCVRCHSVYTRDQVVRVDDSGTTVIQKCSSARFTKGKYKGKCGADLVQRVVLKNGKVEYRPHKVFCYRSVIDSLNSMLKRPDFEKHCNAWRDRDSGELLSDVYDGSVWKDFLTKPNGSPFLSVQNNYAFQLNVDWFQPYKHRSDMSVGVMYLALMNLPRTLRFRQDNVIITGIIPAFRHEPKNINSFLEPLVKDLNLLWERGVVMQTHEHPDGVRVGAALLNAAADIPACRKLCGFLGCNAKLGCSKCLKKFPGSVGCMNFGGFDTRSWKARSVSDHRQWAKKISQCKSHTEAKNLESQCGYRFSALLNLPYFDTVRHHTIDPMHNLYLGTAKNMFKMWVNDGILNDKDLSMIEQRIKQIAIASDAGWVPRGFTSNWRSFNAHEWKCWTLVYSCFVLKGIIPDSDLHVWEKFVLACQKLSKSCLTPTDVSLAHGLIMNFLNAFENKYGSEKVTPNMHLHAHLQNCILEYGSVYGFWLFSFERFNGILGSVPTNNKNIEIQLMQHFLQNEALCNLDHQIPGRKTAQFLKLKNSIIKNPEATNPLCQTHNSVYGKVPGSSPRQWSNLGAVQLPSTHYNTSLDSDEAEHLKSVYSTLYPNSTIAVPLCYRRYSHINISNQQFGTRSCERVGEFCAIVASWAAACGEVDTTLSNGIGLRAGRVRYFIKHCVQLDDHIVPHVFACVHWYISADHHEYRSPLSVWYSNHYVPQGPASYIPVQRIMGKFASMKIRDQAQSLQVIMPSPLRVDI